MFRNDFGAEDDRRARHHRRARRDRSAPQLSIVVPLFNEAGTLEELHRRLRAVVVWIDLASEIIYVDDGSDDGTSQAPAAVAAHDEHVRVIPLARNYGQTAALAAGFDAAAGDLIVAMDGDLQHAPEEIPKLLAKLHEGYDIVSGWREQRVDNLWTRRLPSKVKLLIMLMAGITGALVGAFAWQPKVHGYSGAAASGTTVALSEAPAVAAASSAAPAAPGALPDSGSERHHYRLAARVRPLIVFWISRSNVGDAVMTRAREREGARYSLLIGSDPSRAPFHINRWGYIEEAINGAEARLIGLMTESEEESIEQAEASARRQSGAHHSFRVIEGMTDGEQARSRVMSIALPEDYTLHQMRTVLDLAQRDWSSGKSRALQLPPGVRPGFLAAVADAMHDTAADSIIFVYYGRLYELRRTRTEAIPNLQIGRETYGPAVAADFLITSSYDGEQTRFAMTYGTRGPFAEVPLRAMFQPRWWMQVELTIDDGNDVSSSSKEAGQ